MQSPRPVGVSFLALMEIVGGFAGVALGAYYVNALNSIVSELGLQASIVPDFYFFFVAEAGLGMIALPLGYGLWKGRKWGLTFTADFSVASLVFYVGFGSYFVAQYDNYTELTAGAVGLVVALIAAVYLSRPSVREFFDGVDGAPAQAGESAPLGDLP